MNADRLDNGFTLLEVMVALSLIATAFVTLLGTHAMSLNLAQKHKEQMVVSMMARQKMEEVLSLPFDSLEDDSGDFGPAYAEYRWELDSEDTDTDNLKRVTIVIMAPDGRFELETLVARTLVE
jgi:type II secretion system protein I